MNTQITTYNFNQNQIRTTSIDGEPWFCLTDCRSALSIKGSLKVGTLSKRGVTKSYISTNGGEQELTFINEPNLYRLIFRSNKPQAQAFADWVYSEVLPSIRKTGTYGVPATCEGLSADDRKTIGGIVKRCVKSAIKECMGNLLSIPQEAEQTELKAQPVAVVKLMEAIVDYGDYRYREGRIGGIIKGALSPEMADIRSYMELKKK